MGKSTDPMDVLVRICRSGLSDRSGPIVSMSFQLAIPWRVALQQSPPPLHQPVPILHYGRQVVQCFCSERQTVS